MVRSSAGEHRPWWPAVFGWWLAISSAAYGLECATDICVGDPCTISGDHQLSDRCQLDFGSKTVTIAGSLAAGSVGSSFSISAGSLKVTGSLIAPGGVITIDVTGSFHTDGSGTINVNRGGMLDVEADGEVVLDGDEIKADGYANDFAGDVLIIGSNITVARTNQIHSNGANGGDGGIVSLLADGDARIAGTIKANGVGADAAGGFVDIEAGPKGNLIVRRTIEAITSDNGLFDGYIALGPACSVVTSGTLRTRNSRLNHPGYGSNVIAYTTSLNATGGSILSDDSGGTEVACRCSDSNADERCDDACAQVPVGLGGRVNPPASVVPTAMPPCGCGDGVVDASLGEQCDDGNVDDGDGCQYDCRLSP